MFCKIFTKQMFGLCLIKHKKMQLKNVDNVNNSVNKSYFRPFVKISERKWICQKILKNSLIF